MQPKQKVVLLLCMICSFQLTSFAQTPDKRYIVTDGPVYALAQKGDTIYMGGSFNNVGYRINKFARFKAGDTLPDLNFPKLKSDASLVGLESDGKDGFFLALPGCSYLPFAYEYNGVKYKTPVLHLLADFSVDISFPPVSLKGGCLVGIKRQGQRLYLAGSFTSVNGSPRQGLAALNVSTGRPLPWNPENVIPGIKSIDANGAQVITVNDDNKYYAYSAMSGAPLNILSVDGTVGSILMDSDKLYVGGNFDNVIQNVKGLATFTGDSLRLNTSFPQLNSGGNHASSIVGDDSGGYYIGGNFLIKNQQVKSVAHILSNGSIDTNFKVSVEGLGGEVLCLAKDKNILYIGGDFNMVNQEDRGCGAAINLSTLQLTSFDPQADNVINCILPVGDTIYLGGYFYKLRYQSHRFAGAITKKNIITSWNPQPDQPMFAMSSNKNNNSIFIAGEFEKVKGKSLPYLAKVDAVSGNPFNWQPQPNYPVYSLAQNGNNLYIGGAFTKLGRIARSGIAAIDTTTTTLTSFAPNPDGGVQAMSIGNNQLYFAGYFTKVLGQARPHVAGIDLSTDSLTSFSQNFDDNVMMSVYFNDSLLVVGGEFQGIRQGARQKFAVIDLNENKLDLYDTKNYFYSYTGGSIQKMYRYNNDLFLAGNFDYSDGHSYCTNLMALSVDSVSVTHYFSTYPYDPSFLNQLSVNNNKLYIGGSFNEMINKSSNQITGNRLNIAAYDLKTNELTPDTYNPNSQVSGLIVDKYGNLVFAGYFGMVKTAPRQGLAALDINTGYVTNWNPSITYGKVSSLAIKDSSMYIGGSFGSIYDGIQYSSASLACINTNTGLLKNWNYSLDDQVNVLVIQDSTLYIGGAFHNINNTQRFYAAAISLSKTGGVTNWNPNPNIFVAAIAPHGKEIYLGGQFTKINNVDQSYLAKVKNTDGSLLSWQPAPDSYVSDLYISGSTLYAGGNFTGIKTKARNSLAAFDAATGSLLPFNAKIQYNSTSYSNTITAMLVSADQLYIGSNYITKVKGKKSGNLFSIDTNGISTSNFNPQPNGGVSTLLSVKNKLFTGGSWDSIAGNDLSNFAVFILDSSSFLKHSQYNNIQQALATASQTTTDDAVSIFPNPVTHNAQVKMKSIDALTTMILTDISGKLLWQSGKLTAPVVTVPMDKLSGGIYLLLILNKGKQNIFKIIKQ